MTDEVGKTYERAERLRVQITTMAQEMFGHFATLGMPPTMVLLLPDGEITMHDLARAREAARCELGEITTELRVREKQLAHVNMQKSPIELASLDDIEAGCLRQDRRRCGSAAEKGARSLDRHRSCVRGDVLRRSVPMLVAFIGGRAIVIPPKPRPATPTIPPRIQPLRPQRYSLILAWAMPKVCRTCSAPIPPSQRFCGARCRLEASGSLTRF